MNVPPAFKSKTATIHCLVALTASALLLAGCGNVDSRDQQNPAGDQLGTGSNEQSTSTDATADESGGVDSDFYESYTTQLEAEDGTTADIWVDVGRVLPASDPGLPSEYTELANACESESNRDAVIPVVVRVKNTTDRFTGTFRLVERVLPRPSLGTEEIRRIATTFSDSGPSCQANNQVATSIELDPGESGRQVSAVVLGNYYNPSSPEGDISAFNLTEFQLAHNSGSRITNLEFDGPNAVGSEILLLDAARH